MISRTDASRGDISESSGEGKAWSSCHSKSYPTPSGSAQKRKEGRWPPIIKRKKKNWSKRNLGEEGGRGKKVGAEIRGLKKRLEEKKKKYQESSSDQSDDAQQEGGCKGKDNSVREGDVEEDDPISKLQGGRGGLIVKGGHARHGRPGQGEGKREKVLKSQGKDGGPDFSPMMMGCNRG